MSIVTRRESKGAKILPCNVSSNYLHMVMFCFVLSSQISIFKHSECFSKHNYRNCFAGAGVIVWSKTKKTPKNKQKTIRNNPLYYSRHVLHNLPCTIHATNDAYQSRFIVCCGLVHVFNIHTIRVTSLTPGAIIIIRLPQCLWNNADV